MTLYRALLWLCAALLPGGVLLVPLLVIKSARQERRATSQAELGVQGVATETRDVVGLQP